MYMSISVNMLTLQEKGAETKDSPDYVQTVRDPLSIIFRMQSDVLEHGDMVSHVLAF